MSIQYDVEPLADSYGVADSFPKDFGYGEEEEADIEDSPSPSDSKPRILLMGLRRSGKSSIQKVGEAFKWWPYPQFISRQRYVSQKS